MAARLISSIYWLFVALSSIVMFPIALVTWALTVLWDRRLVILHQVTCFWASLYTWFNPLWRVRVEGRHHIVPGVTYVMVANHSSATDIFVLYRLFRHFKWVSKIENFRVPLIGWNMRLNRYIPLRRGDKDSVLRMLQTSRETLAAGSSIMMFPEGTRSLTEELRPFKRGAFDLAKDAGVAILPVVLAGTRQALAKHGLLCGRADIVVRVLEPIAPSTFAATGADVLADQIRSRISAELAVA